MHQIGGDSKGAEHFKDRYGKVDEVFEGRISYAVAVFDTASSGI